MRKGRRREQLASLDRALGKLARADALLAGVADSIGEFTPLGPDALVGSVSRDGRVHEYRWNAVSPLGGDVEHTVGECVHNARCALDHLADALVVLNRREPSPAVVFPIEDHRPPRRRRRAPAIRGASTQANALVEEVQPYCGRPVGARLRLLRDLDELDRRQGLRLVMQVFDAGERSADARRAAQVVALPGPAERGRPAARIRYEEPRAALDADLYLGARVGFDRPQYGALRGRSVAEILEGLLHAVRVDVIEQRFAPLFAGRP